MLRNRIIYCILLILTLVFASNYGGNMVYCLFYAVVLLPLCSFLYTYVVFRRFSVYQDIPERITQKYTVLPYSLALENRDYFSYDNIRFICNESLARLSDDIDIGTLHMEPKTARTMEGNIKCLYRGTYYVGIERIEVTDYFGLFRIAYDFPSKVRLTVKPRILPLEQLKVAENSRDAKRNLYTTQLDSVLGNEMRNYMDGDSPRHINWKVSARYNELYVRKPDVKELVDTVLFLDTYCYWKTENDCIIHSDPMIETALSIAKHYCDRRLQLNVVYHDKSDVVMSMSNVNQFNSFYKEMGRIFFSEQYRVEQAASTYFSRKSEAEQHVIFVVYKVTEELVDFANVLVNKGQRVTLLVTGTEDVVIALPKRCQLVKVVADYEMEH